LWGLGGEALLGLSEKRVGFALVLAAFLVVEVLHIVTKGGGGGGDLAPVARLEGSAELLAVSSGVIEPRRVDGQSDGVCELPSGTVDRGARSEGGAGPAEHQDSREGGNRPPPHGPGGRGRSHAGVDGVMQGAEGVGRRFARGGSE
jgi:hypothetical protein